MMAVGAGQHMRMRTGDPAQHSVSVMLIGQEVGPMMLSMQYLLV